MSTDPTHTASRGALRFVTRWRIEVSDGPAKGLVHQVTAGIVTVGSAATNDIVLDDRKVSRHHVEIDVRPSGLRVRDLGSKNGTYTAGTRVEALELPIAGGIVSLGTSELTLLPDDEPVAWAASVRERCGRLCGRSALMRDLYALIERIASSNANVLIHGETGTGKELTAEAIHELGTRRDGPFVVFDCGAIPSQLIESSLFGHARGAFTGAHADRKGVFEQANGGTLFLDEIGELELSLQPKLLRVLADGRVLPVGSAGPPRQTDVRVIAATNRDLLEEVRAKRFREDLYFRLSVLPVETAPLRDRLEDLPLLAEEFLAEQGAPPLGVEALTVLKDYSWPGNVRQLRNVLERAAALANGGPLSITTADLDEPSSRLSPSHLLRLPYKEAKEEMVAEFTREYVEALLQRHNGNVSAAAREAKLARNWLTALARRLGIRVRD
jgi:transcriptional regulator with GAF, ATPase, and Fis domain